MAVLLYMFHAYRWKIEIRFISLSDLACRATYAIYVQLLPQANEIGAR